MYAKTFVTLMLPILAVHALPAKRDEYDDALSLITGADTNTADAAELNSILNSGPSGTPVSALPTASVSAAVASIQASLLLSAAHIVIGDLPSASQTQFTAFVTTIAGAPVVEMSSIGGPAITLATTGGVPTAFAGHTLLAVPGKKNGASGLSVSRPLLTGMVGALGAVAAGAMMLL